MVRDCQRSRSLVMVDIPLEIISDILRRLPAKSLCRFKVVSKSWLSLISQPQFHKDHLNTVKLTRLICDQGPICTFPLYDQETPKLSLRFPKRESTVYFSHGSCNGLVLGSAFLGTFDKSRVFDRLVVLNPTTKEYIKLSDTHYETFDNYTDHRCGFGYDCVTDDYKVVTLAYYYERNRDLSVPIYVHVYSLKTNTWRRLADYPYPYDHYNDFFNLEKVHGVLVNGCLHWVATKRANNVFLRVIVGFSLADETFSEVPSPDWGNNVDMRVCKLVAFGEKLGIFVGDVVWLMNEYGVGDSWSKITIRGFDASYVKPLIHFEDGRILLVSDKLLRVYDVEEESFIKSVDISRDIKGMVRVTYVESLVSLKSTSCLTVYKLKNSHGNKPATPQDATGRGGARDGGASGGRGRSGVRGGGRDNGTSGGKGRSGGGGRGGGRGSRGDGGRG